MMTCKLTHCPQLGRCRLEENGATDLCPVLSLIKAEAIRQTEIAWASKYPAHEVVPLDHFTGTRTVSIEGFTLALALRTIAALEAARRKATLDKIAYENTHNIIIIDPKPRPEWEKQVRAGQLKKDREKRSLDFHEVPTLTADYNAYPMIQHVEDVEAKELKVEEEITKRQKRRWLDYNARKKTRANRVKCHNYYMQMEDDIRINK